MALLSIMLAAASVPVYVGRFDPEKFPNLITVERQLPHAEMTQRVEKIFADGQCSIGGQDKRKFDIEVRYAVLMDSEGSAHQVVVEDKDCNPLELLVGQIVAARVARKDFKIAHVDGARWYVSDLYFALGEPVNAAAIADKDKRICKRTQSAVGSRTKLFKVCKTAAEWQIFEADRQQLRRDIQQGPDSLVVE